MQVGKVEVGAWQGGGVPGIQMSQDVRDKLREKRNLGLQKLKTLGLAKLVVSFLTVVIGIATLIVASRGPAGWPVFNFGPIIVGVIMFIIGGLAVAAGKKGDDITNISVEETPAGVKGLFVAHYVLSVTCIGLCVVAGAFAFLTVGICIGGSEKLDKNCYPDKDANIALGAIGGVLCVVLAFLCIVACVFFCVYARSFGFKNRYERAMEYQMAAMMRTMQEQQQGQFQGQPMQGQGQWGQYYGPPPSYK